MITTEELDDLFNYDDTPPQFLPEPLQVAKPSRVRQLLSGLMSDETILPDVSNEYETPEWEEDFEFKATTLRNVFPQTMPEELYIELFGSLESKCHLLLDKMMKVTPKSFYELERYIQEHDDVFLYNQEFKWQSVDRNSGELKKSPKTYDALIGFRCFVVDIDYVNAGNIRSVIEMIMTAPILPNYVNLTGNGLHLYFIFDAVHNMKHSAWLMAFVKGTSSKSERDVYVTIKQGMIAWYNGSTAGSDVQNHLAQPSRLAGSKTKNRNKRTILFKVSDTKYSIQHIAELLGIELPDEENIRRWKKKVEADRRQEGKKRQKASASTALSLLDFFDHDAPESALEVVDLDDTGNDTDDDPVIVNVSRKYQFDWEKFRQQILDDRNRELQSPEALYFAEQKRIRAERRASVGYQQLRVAQRRGLESQYEQFKQYCFDVARHGKRATLLHIFWNRASAYQKDMNVIQRDFDDLFMHCNALHRTKEVTKKQYDSIVNGPRIKYGKDAIHRHLDTELKFKNKRNDELQGNRDTKDNKWKRIYVICETVLENNPSSSWEHILNTVNSYGIDVSDKTLRTRPEVRELKARLRS